MATKKAPAKKAAPKLDKPKAVTTAKPIKAKQATEPGRKFPRSAAYHAYRNGPKLPKQRVKPRNLQVPKDES